MGSINALIYRYEILIKYLSDNHIDSLAAIYTAIG